MACECVVQSSHICIETANLYWCMLLFTLSVCEVLMQLNIIRCLSHSETCKITLLIYRKHNHISALPSDWLERLVLEMCGVECVVFSHRQHYIQPINDCSKPFRAQLANLGKSSELTLKVKGIWLIRNLLHSRNHLVVGNIQNA